MAVSKIIETRVVDVGMNLVSTVNISITRFNTLYIILGQALMYLGTSSFLAKLFITAIGCLLQAGWKLGTRCSHCNTNLHLALQFTMPTFIISGALVTSSSYRCVSGPPTFQCATLTSWEWDWGRGYKSWTTNLHSVYLASETMHKLQTTECQHRVLLLKRVLQLQV